MNNITNNQTYILYIILILAILIAIYYIFKAINLNKSLVLSQQKTQEIANLNELQAYDLKYKDQELQEFKQLLQQGQQTQKELQNLLFEAKTKVSVLESEIQTKEQYYANQKELFEQNKQSFTDQFEVLSNKILAEKSKQFAQSGEISLKNILEPLRSQLNLFQNRINQVHDKAVEQNSTLSLEIKKVQEAGLKMMQDATDLTEALKGNKKVLGNWGENVLARCLDMSGLQENVHYSTQINFVSDEGKRQIPDFIIHLPNQKNLIIDSKVSLENYKNACSSDDQTKVEYYLKEHIKNLRNHIDGLSAKNYANLKNINSPMVVFMFIPIEGAFLEAIKFDENLYDYAVRKNVILTSHTTLIPVLKTTAQSWMMAQSNKKIIDITDQAASIYNQFSVLVNKINSLGNSIDGCVRNFNDLNLTFSGNRGIYNKISRFRDISTKATKELNTINQLEAKCDNIISTEQSE